MNMHLIDRNPAHRGMSDDQVASERRAQDELQASIRIMRAAIRLVNSSSCVQQIDMGEFDAFLHDTMPDVATWNERIQKARAA